MSPLDWPSDACYISLYESSQSLFKLSALWLILFYKKRFSLFLFYSKIYTQLIEIKFIKFVGQSSIQSFYPFFTIHTYIHTYTGYSVQHKTLNNLMVGLLWIEEKKYKGFWFNNDNDLKIVNFLKRCQINVLANVHETHTHTTITDTDYADDIALLANTPNQAETLLHSLERAAAGIDLYVNAHKTEYMCFNHTGDISTLDGTSLKLVDKFTYLGSSVSSTEKDIDTRLTKASTAIDRLSIIWKSDLTDKMKRSFFQAAIVSMHYLDAN